MYGENCKGCETFVFTTPKEARKIEDTHGRFLCSKCIINEQDKMKGAGI